MNELGYSQIAAHHARLRRIAAQATGEPIPERVARLLAPHWLYGYNTGCTDGAAKEIAVAWGAHDKARAVGDEARPIND